MYTLLVNENNELITTVKERIMQRSKLVDSLHILVDPIYKEHNMSDFTVMMEYLMPVSREYHTEILVKSDSLYKNQLEYKLPFDTCLTKEAGKIEIQLTFVKVELTADGESKQYVRKAGPAKITIVPISAWSDIIADSALSALDQRLIQVDAMINYASEMNQMLNETKADNITYNEEDSTIQLTANGNPIGNVVAVGGKCDCSAMSCEIDENGDLIVVLYDGRVINAGHVVGKDGVDGVNGVTFIPHISDDYILSWTNDGGLDNPTPIDIYPHDEWVELLEPAGGVESEYVWELI